MFEFSSKPIAISDGTVLCQDYSIWTQIMTEEGPTFTQIACYKPKQKEKKEQVSTPYAAEFEYMWDMWKDNIKNPSNKKLSFTAFQKLSKEEKTALCYSINPYSKTNNDHQYLKRCETYINQKHWENIEAMEEMSKSVMPGITDVAWDMKIYNQDTGITCPARNQVEKFGMDMNEAWRLMNDS